MKKKLILDGTSSKLIYTCSKDYYITGRANPIFCAVGLR